MWFVFRVFSRILCNVQTMVGEKKSYYNLINVLFVCVCFIYAYVAATAVYDDVVILKLRKL